MCYFVHFQWKLPMFLLLRENDISFSKRGSKEEVLSLFVIVDALSWKWFILLLTFSPWNIHRSGQYLNWDSKYASISILLFSKFKNFNILLSMVNFLFALGQTFNKCELNFKPLFVFTPRSLTSFDFKILSFPRFA